MIQGIYVSPHVERNKLFDGIAALRPHQPGKLIDAEREEAERDKDFTLLKRQRCENFEAR